MQPLPPIYEALCREANPAADAALADALPLLTDPHRDYAVDALLRRAQPLGMLGLIAHLDALSSSGLRRVIASTARMFPALRLAMREARPETREHAIRIIRESGNLRLSYLAAIGIRDASPRVREAAGVALRELADHYYRREQETLDLLRESAADEPDVVRAAAHALHMLAEERGYLTQALGQAMASFGDHHRLEILEASMLFPLELGATLFDHSPERRGKYTHAMTEVFSSCDEPRLALFACIALTHSETRSAVLRRIEARTDNAFFAEWLRHAWLLRDPAIARATHNLRRLAWLEAGIEPLFALPRELQAAVPNWLLSTGLPQDLKVDLLGQMLDLNNREAARAAVWSLARIVSQSSTHELRRAMALGDPEIRRIAERVLAARRRATLPTLRLPAGGTETLASCPEPEFDFVWSHFDLMDPTDARALGERLRGRPRRFGSKLASVLLSDAAEERGRAVRLVAVLGLVDDYLDELSRLSADVDAHVRATVVTALSSGGGSAARRILERALFDANPRVVANAVDALGESGAEIRGDLLAPLLQNGDNRIRASAVRALLLRQTPEAALALVHMLEDPRRAHRISALWLVEQLELVLMLERVAHMEQSDREESVRAAAARVHRTLNSAAARGRRPAAAPAEAVT